jgi:hypothetical protein
MGIGNGVRMGPPEHKPIVVEGNNREAEILAGEIRNLAKGLEYKSSLDFEKVAKKLAEGDDRGLAGLIAVLENLKERQLKKAEQS